MCNKVEKFKQNFFDLPSREFGETYVESILRKVLGDSINSNGNEFDAMRVNLRVEYKAIRVLFSPKGKVSTLYDSVMANVHMSNRIGSIKDIEEGKIVANCQNIKLDDFDILNYVLVDNEGFHIFEISADDFKNLAKEKKFPNWSPNHGRKEKGKNGQFPIKKENIKWHKARLKQSLVWKDIMAIAEQIVW